MTAPALPAMTDTQRRERARQCADTAAGLLVTLEATWQQDAKGMSELVARITANAAVASALSSVVQASALKLV